MPPRDALHGIVEQALIKNGWRITDDPFVISYGERFLFVDLGAVEREEPSTPGRLVGAEREGERIAIEIKPFQRPSRIADLEQAIGQYVLYRLLLAHVDPDRLIYLAITDVVFDEFFSEPIGELVVQELPLQLLVVNPEKVEIRQWIPSRFIERS
jgi:hypothetical protein